MCGVSEKLNSKTSVSSSAAEESNTLATTMENGSNVGVGIECSFSDLLEFAADNDVEGFKRHVCDVSTVNKVGLWYGRQMFSRKMVTEQRTPLMVAATYGSVDIVTLIVSLPEVDINFSCGTDKTTALHCAASGGSLRAVDVVRLLLDTGADRYMTDAHGLRPSDVIFAPRGFSDLKASLEEILKDSGSGFPLPTPDMTSSPAVCKPNDSDPSWVPEKKEFPIDPSLPDIKSSIYTTDEFRMFSFKIRPCSRAYSHDWTECPFAHPGENARRRDPRKFHYSCVPCPDFKKGTCKHGDMCEYAHGVFECWLHPAQYRTRLCKDGASCTRRVCFFAHATEDLRPLFASTGSGVPSPRAMDMASILNMSPSFTPPMSPSGNSLNPSMGWPPHNIPSLHLQGSNPQTSRLRSSLNARDIPSDGMNMVQQQQQQQLFDELSYMSRSPRLTPSNLDERFCSEVLSPRYSDQLAASSVLSPSHKSMLLSQLQQKQSMLSPIRTNVLSPKNIDHHFLQASHNNMSPRAVDPLSPLRCRQQQQQHQHQHLRKLGSNNVGSPLTPRSKWEHSSGIVDWSVRGDELGRLRKSGSMGRQSEDTDFSWIQPSPKDSPSKINGGNTLPALSVPRSRDGSAPNLQNESSENDILDAWLEHLQLDQIVAQ